jgi:hypothetical protein
MTPLYRILNCIGPVITIFILLTIFNYSFPYCYLCRKRFFFRSVIRLDISGHARVRLCKTCFEEWDKTTETVMRESGV